jgi:cytoskeletal protein CcmA (bactofilin family)
MDTTRDSSAEERRLAAWIGDALLVRGDVISTRDLVIHGRVEGTIDLGDHSLTIGVGASVVADLVAKSVTISGEVKGNVTAMSSVALLATGSVEGNVTTPRLIMEDGAVLRGRVDVDGSKAARAPVSPPSAVSSVA